MSSLLRLEHQMRDVSKSTLKLYIALSFSVFIWKWNNKYTYIHSRSFLKIHTQFQTKMGKMYTSLDQKRPKNRTLWDSTNLQSNLSNTDTEGTERSVRIREVARGHNDDAIFKSPLMVIDAIHWMDNGTVWIKPFGSNYQLLKLYRTALHTEYVLNWLLP